MRVSSLMPAPYLPFTEHQTILSPLQQRLCQKAYALCNKVVRVCGGVLFGAIGISAIVSSPIVIYYVAKTQGVALDSCSVQNNCTYILNQCHFEHCPETNFFLGSVLASALWAGASIPGGTWLIQKAKSLLAPASHA